MLCKIFTTTLVATSLSVVAMAQPIQESDATNILDNYRSGFNALSIYLCLDRNKQSLTGKDLQQAFTVKQNEVVGLLNRGDRTMAAAKASTMLNGFGHCYGKSTLQTDREIYAGFMGGFIATQALAYGDDSKMQQAITLLDYAKSHGQTNTQFLNLVKDHRQAEPESGEVESHSLKTLYDAVNANYPRFKRDYEGKPVSLSGIVRDIDELDWPKKAVWVVIDTGVKTEYASCDLTEDQFDKAYDLDKGQKITITGNVKASSASVANSLRLKNCKIG